MRLVPLITGFWILPFQRHFLSKYIIHYSFPHLLKIKVYDVTRNEVSFSLYFRLHAFSFPPLPPSPLSSSLSSWNVTHWFMKPHYLCFMNGTLFESEQIKLKTTKTILTAKYLQARITCHMSWNLRHCNLVLLKFDRVLFLHGRNDPRTHRCTHGKICV